MSELALYNQEGKKLKVLAAPEGLLEGPVRKGLLYYAVNYQLAKRRSGTHDSRSRGQVRGSTRKMGRQKGSGRARHGDRKAPIFVGGGQAFGPQPRDYSFTMPRSAKKRSLQSALRLKEKEGQLLAVEKPAWSSPKTKQAQTFFSKLEARSALLVLAERDEVIEKSIRNLYGYKVLPVIGLNVYDILKYDKLLLAEDALEKIAERVRL